MRDLINIGNNQIDKHNKYKIQYKPSSIYWGLGIEIEVYLEFEKYKEITKKEFLENHKRERYSVDYYSNYKKNIIEKVFKLIHDKFGNSILYMPVLMNSHSFIHTDIFNNSKTLYTKKGEANPDFFGFTLQEYLELKNKFFDQTNPKWIFDGDTIEFISTNFFNVKLSDVLKEVESNKNTFIDKLNHEFKILDEISLLKKYGKIKIMEKNHPFAIHLTNYNNVAIFNNGTIHFNITLPTKLNENSEIFNKEKFIEMHKKAIKMIQWFEPLIIAVYGSPDPFSILQKEIQLSENLIFSSCSQRNAISRYISIGTYDTDLMESGKILVKSIDDLSVSKLDYWWFNRFHKNSAYIKLDKIGLDINFNKHWNHGIEIRFLDYINNNNLIKECLEFIIYLMDLSLESKIDDLKNPIISPEFNDLVFNIMCHSTDYSLDKNTIKFYESICKFNLEKTNVEELYYEIFDGLKKKFNKEFIELESSRQLNKSEVTKLIMPVGLYSSLVLDTKFSNIKAEDTNTIDEFKIEDKSNTPELIKNYYLNKQISYINEQINNLDYVEKFIDFTNKTEKIEVINNVNEEKTNLESKLESININTMNKTNKCNCCIIM